MTSTKHTGEEEAEAPYYKDDADRIHLAQPTPTPERKCGICQKVKEIILYAGPGWVPICSLECGTKHFDSMLPTPERKNDELLKTDGSYLVRGSLESKATPESRLRESFYDSFGLEIEVDEPRKMMVYSMKAKNIADWWLSKFSQERESLVGEVEKLPTLTKKIHTLKNETVEEVYITRDRVVALLKSKN